ncbi:MltR family transcriptional regulator [Vibrio owensii]|uniref:MltR family transcriptional regulator n=1 Tax=Vibrio owensii TaxID=696485 RepID=UPI00215CAD5C|nr:MltR family transcriptional regulator [Vibrio owensii]MCR9941997.1 MltR family transcriptional regulator [Vibrio owensii]
MFQIDIDESDRGCMIVAAANIEEFLDRMLKAIIESSPISKKKSRAMFDTTGPFGNFSAKYLMLATFGYLSKETFDDLEKLRKLRNMFAHTAKAVKFEDPEVYQVLVSMRCFKNANKHMNKQLGLPPDNMPSIELDMTDNEAQYKGFVKRVKSDFVIGMSLLANDIIEDMEQRLSKQQN